MSKTRAIELDIDDVFNKVPHYSCRIITDDFKVMGSKKIVRLKLKQDKFLTFKKNKYCVCCGLEGTRVLSYYEGGRPHVNLFGKKNKRTVLMTKDHIVPHSKGGRNHIDNYQTMCEHCNNVKGASIIDNESLFVIKNRLIKLKRRGLKGPVIRRKLDELKHTLWANKSL